MSVVARSLSLLRVRMGAPGRWLVRAVRYRGREREDVVQAAKMALAAVLAWSVARWIPSPQTFIAPYAAVFVISETVYRSLANAARQVAALAMGIVVAYVAIRLTGWPFVALPIAVFAGMLVGRWNRLAESGVWVGVIALLMVTYGTADNGMYLVARVADTVLGAAIGAAVNILVLPPVYLRSGRRAVDDLEADIERLLRSMSERLGTRWDRKDAESWLSQARALDTATHRADKAVDWARESTRYNPRWLFPGRFHRQRSAPWADAAALRALREVAVQLQRISEALLADSAGADGRPATPSALCRAVADVLAAFADAVHTYHTDGDDEMAGARLRRVRAAHHPLASAPCDGSAGQHAVPAQGAIVVAVERALHVLDDEQGRRHLASRSR